MRRAVAWAVVAPIIALVALATGIAWVGRQIEQFETDARRYSEVDR